MRTIFSKERGLIALLLVAALAVRVTAIWHPNQVVFDEVHFGKFVTAYCCTGQRFFDIHPPHGKLMIAGAAYLFGYRGGFDFDHIGEVYTNISVVALRILPALAGALIPLLAYGIMRQVGASRGAAFLAGAVLALDNAQVVQSRLISLDTILISAQLASVLIFLRAQEKSDTWHKFGLMAVAGVFAGLSAGVKLTGLAALAVIGLAVLWQLFQTKSLVWIKYGSVIVVSAVLTYLLGWFIHFQLLQLPGEGDAWGIPTGNFAADILSTNQQMLSANYNLTQTHPYSSKWWTWPLMMRPVFYWVGSDGGKIYFLGNPVLWWGASILLVAAAVSLAASRRDRLAVLRGQGWILFAGYVVAYLPFVRVPRALFLYHYLTPLIFSLMAGLYWLDKRSSGKIFTRRVVTTVVTISILWFALFSPLTYGLSSESWQALAFWFPSWR